MFKHAIWTVNDLANYILIIELLLLSGRGIYILYEDVKSCPYEDVHVLWSILVESRPPALPSHKYAQEESMKCNNYTHVYCT